MEKITERDIIVKKRTIHFYCDCCNAEIGVSEEFDDGYYEEFGEISTMIVTRFDNNPHVRNISGNLCDNCAEKFLKELDESINKIAANFNLRKDNEEN